MTGRVFYFDAVHPLGEGTAVVNGDRRIGNYGSLVDVAELVAAFVERAGDQSVFFGCTAHQPGSWWVTHDRVEPLHGRGLVDLVPASRGLLARRIVDDALYFVERDRAIAGLFDKPHQIYRSPLGNILLLERRVIDGRLVLSCTGGLIELDVGGLPAVVEVDRLANSEGFAVVGRVTNGPFAVTRGEPQEWGLDHIGPAVLVGSEGTTLSALDPLLRTL